MSTKQYSSANFHRLSQPSAFSWLRLWGLLSFLADLLWNIALTSLLSSYSELSGVPNPKHMMNRGALKPCLVLTLSMPYDRSLYVLRDLCRAPEMARPCHQASHPKLDPQEPHAGGRSLKPAIVLLFRHAGHSMCTPTHVCTHTQI